MHYLKEFGFKNQKVLLRVDFNVPIENNAVANDFRIRAVLPTLEYLMENQAKIIILTHLGRPKGQVVADLKVNLVAERLSQLIKKPVKKVDDCVGEKVVQAVNELQTGEILFLENVQFHPGETKNDQEFARDLASLADFFVMDAFGQAHRQYASVASVPKHLPSCAGFLLEKEIQILSEVIHNPRRPLVVAIGGAKIATKLPIIKQFLQTADDILLGGAIANTVIMAKGFGIGKSKVEEIMINELKHIDLANNKLHLPVDAIAASDPSGRGRNRVSAIGNTFSDEMILDIGPDTVKLYDDIVKEAATVLWNGPMGLFEVEEFAHGTEQLAKTIVKNDIYSVIGGGDTISYLDKANMLSKIDHVSTGGGAMLSFLAQEKLPGLEALKEGSQIK